MSRMAQKKKKKDLIEELAYLEEELIRRGKVPPKVDPRAKWQNSFRYMKFQRTYARDPAAFAHDCIDWDGGGPTEYQDHALESIIPKKRIALWGPRGLGKCLSLDEKVLLSDGSWVVARDLIGLQFSVPSVDANLSVCHRRAVAFDNGLQEVVEIVTEKGRVARVTANHPFWGDVTPQRWDENRWAKGMNPVGSWIEAQDLCPGSVVAVWCGSSRTNPIAVEDDWVKVCASLIADGSISSSSITYHKIDPILLDDFCESCHRLGCDTRLFTRGGIVRGAYVVGRPGSRNVIRDRLRECGLLGKNSYGKSFPDFVWRLDDRQLCLFIGTLYAGDGWISVSQGSKRTRRQIGYSTVSYQLARDLSKALLRLGIQANIVNKKAKLKRKDGSVFRCDAYDVTINDADNIVAFCKLITVKGKEAKQLAILESVDDIDVRFYWRKRGLPNHLRWERVVAVNNLGLQPTVGIAVEDTQTFLTEFVEHNTRLLSVLAWWGLLTVDHVKETITAGSFRQLERILWPEIRALVPKIKWDYIGRPPPQERKEIKQTDITLSDTALTITASPREAGKFEGAHAKQRVLAIFDESKEIEDDIFDSVEGSFSHTEQPLAIAASTPGLQAGRFYDICRGGPGYLDWYRIHVSKDDMIKAGFMDPEWAENRRLQWGEDNPKYINQVEGDFANDDPSTIIPFHWVSKAKDRWLDMEANGTLPTRANRVGVDCAWGGADRAVITRAHNNVILTIREYDYRDTVQLAGQVMMDVSYDKQIPIVVDVIGWGAGVYDTLKHGGYNVVAFNAGAKSEFDGLGPEDEELEFLNNRAASWYYTWTLFDPNNPDAAAIPDHEYLDAELSTPKWKPTQSGKYQVESKHDIRKRRKGRSTDYADSAIMAWIADAILRPKKSKTEVAIVTFALNRGSPSIRIR